MVHKLLITGGTPTHGVAGVIDGLDFSPFITIHGVEMYGLLRCCDRVYVSVRGRIDAVLAFDGYRLCSKYIFARGADPHGVYMDELGRVSVVSSSEDIVYHFSPDLVLLGTTVYGVGGNNRRHINDAFVLGGVTYMSMFTDTPDGSWGSASSSGLVTATTSQRATWAMKGLYMPHSPSISKDDLWVCNSGMGSIWCNDKEVYKEQGTWTRGLCVDGEFTYVGVSDYMRIKTAKVVALTRDGDVSHDIQVPMTYIYSVQALSE